MKIHQDLLNCFQDIVPKTILSQTATLQGSRDITTTYKEEVLFLCSARCLIISV